MKSVFFFGLGYSASATARAIHNLMGKALPILGTSRDGARSANATTLVFDGKAAAAPVATALRSASHVISSIAPTAAGDPALLHHRADLDAAPDLQWLCYFSTVGVYGNFDGAWIDETAPCHPGNLRSDQRVQAEESWRAYAEARGVPLLILRLAGIYGPGRSSFDKLRAGTARRIIKKDQVFNRIHVEDIARVTALAAKSALAGTFNLADDEPAPPQDLVTFAAKRLGIDPPPEVPFENAEMTEMARSFYGDNKRVSNQAIKQALGIELLYPTYREGLNAIHREMA